MHSIPQQHADDRQASGDGPSRHVAFGPEPLTPLAFLDRARVVHADRVALIDGDRTFTYGQFARRCEHLAGALIEMGVRPGDRVSVLAPNSAIALEAHFGVPMAGGVLNALNTRLSAAELGYIVGHAGAEVMFVDHELLELGRSVGRIVAHDVRLVVCGGPDDMYEQLLSSAAPAHIAVAEEWDLISLNYTSGTTGRPKGVMYAHRGAYLQSLAMAAQASLGLGTVFLWTLPMFHCNGWCFPWAVTAMGGRHIALRSVDPNAIWAAIRHDGVTHFNAAPTVLTALAGHPDAAPASNEINVATGGAPPSPALLARLASLNIRVTHLYGLTETYGPAVICDWRPEWDALDADQRARTKARQGVGNLVGRPLRVIDDNGRDVPADGSTMGEVVLRGNNVMLGYYRDPEATRLASVDGPGGAWFRTGDLGVIHTDGYLELRDRSKDVIISGGENIASIEVEQVLDAHPDVVESAVVASPDERWGEVPIAYVTLRPGATASESDLIEHVKARIARFKAPKRIVFGDLPKTGTGKIQKYVLRSRAQQPEA